MPEARSKACHVGVPAIYKLELACKLIRDAFGVHCCYLVGSALQRADWRDIDVVLIMDDEAFAAEFPNAGDATFEMDPKWLLNSVSISMWLTEQTGLPVDFKIQAMTRANKLHDGPRQPVGLPVPHQ